MTIFSPRLACIPDYELETEPTQAELVRLAQHPKVVAIGETGLDYYRLTGNLDWQRDRFRTHIRAAIQSGKPLIIHTRSAADDTLRIMAEENAGNIGGVMHCFTENLQVAEAAIEMGFYISFLRHRDIQERDRHQRGRPEHSARKDPDRNRFSIPGADAAPG